MLHDGKIFVSVAFLWCQGYITNMVYIILNEVEV